MSNEVRLFDKTSAIETINKLGEEDLVFLNRLIVERLKLISQARSTQMMAHFTIGDRIHFRTSAGETKTGVISRLNKKTASIITDDGQNWNVAPGLLMLLKDEPKTPQDQGYKISRNQPCPCGSGKKYKKCCGRH